MTPDGTTHANAPIVEPPTPEQMARIEVALEALPCFAREVFLAHRLDDLGYVEIAERTGTSVKRVEQAMRRAITALLCANTEESSPRRWWRR